MLYVRWRVSNFFSYLKSDKLASFLSRQIDEIIITSSIIISSILK